MYLRKKVVIQAGSKRPVVVPKLNDKDEVLYDSEGDVDIEANTLEDTEPKDGNLSKKNLKRYIKNTKFILSNMLDVSYS